MTAATSIRIPPELKSRIERQARRSGESPHAFMLRALEAQIDAAERCRQFLRDGVRADKAMMRSGMGYTAEDVHDYLKAKIARRRARKPRLVRWRD